MDGAEVVAALMPLHAYTARMGYAGPRPYLDITRGSGGAAGDPFAPSRGLLDAALMQRGKAARLRADAMNLLSGMTQEQRRAQLAQADLIESATWAAYVPLYVAEMRQSYRRRRAAWDALLARDEIVLLCYCPKADECHRRVLAGTILPALGAVDGGEIT